MLNLIADMDALQAEALTIETFLEESISDIPEVCILRGNTLSGYMARTGKMLADAKWHKDQAMKSSIMQTLRDSAAAPPSVMNKLVDAACVRENFLVTWIDRLNRTTTHQIEWLRTVVSKAKREQQLSSGVSGKLHPPQGDNDDEVSPF